MNPVEEQIQELVEALGGDDYVEEGGEVMILKNGVCIAILEDKNAKDKRKCAMVGAKKL